MCQPCASGGAGIVRLQPFPDVFTLVGVAVGGGHWVVHDLKRDRTEELVRRVETRRPSSTANSTTAASTAPASTTSASTLALSSPSGVACASVAPAPFALAIAVDITIAVAALATATLATTMNMAAWHNQLTGPHV